MNTELVEVVPTGTRSNSPAVRGEYCVKAKVEIPLGEHLGPRTQLLHFLTLRRYHPRCGATFCHFSFFPKYYNAL